MKTVREREQRRLKLQMKLLNIKYEKDDIEKMLQKRTNKGIGSP